MKYFYLNIISSSMFQVISALVNAVFISLAVAMLPMYDFGLLALMLSVMSLVNIFERGITKGLAQKIATSTDNERDIDEIYSAAFGLLLTVATTFFCAIVAIITVQAYVTKESWSYEIVTALFIIGCRAVLILPTNVLHGFATGKLKFTEMNSSQIIGLFTKVPLTLVLGYIFGFSVSIFLLAGILSLVIDRIICFKNLKSVMALPRLKKISKPVLLNLISVSSFITVNAFGNLIGTELIKQSIAFHTNLTNVGVYTIAATVGISASLLIRAVANVVMPTVGKLNQQHSQAQIENICGHSLFVSNVVSVIFCILPIFVVTDILGLWFMASENIDAHINDVTYLTILFLVSQHFLNINLVGLQIATGLGHIKNIAYFTITWAVFSLVAVNFLLIFIPGTSITTIANLICLLRISGSIMQTFILLRVLRFNYGKIYINEILYKNSMVAIVAGFLVHLSPKNITFTLEDNFTLVILILVLTGIDVKRFLQK